jgi:hypothetical protein
MEWMDGLVAAQRSVSSESSRQGTVALSSCGSHSLGWSMDQCGRENNNNARLSPRLLDEE